MIDRPSFICTPLYHCWGDSRGIYVTSSHNSVFHLLSQLTGTDFTPPSHVSLPTNHTLHTPPPPSLFSSLIRRSPPSTTVLKSRQHNSDLEKKTNRWFERESSDEREEFDNGEQKYVIWEYGYVASGGDEAESGWLEKKVEWREKERKDSMREKCEINNWIGRVIVIWWWWSGWPVVRREKSESQERAQKRGILILFYFYLAMFGIFYLFFWHVEVCTWVVHHIRVSMYHHPIKFYLFKSPTTYIKA